jgi:cephalosporin-C deacetylase
MPDDLCAARAFDPTYGYDLDGLRAVETPAGPRDFERFWRDTYEAAAAIAPAPEVREIDSPRPDVRLLEVAFTSWGGFRTGGWLTLPRERTVTCGVVVGHGYGGREAPELDLPVPRAAALFPCARGFHRSARPGLPASAAEHVLCGIGSRETYIHRGCVAELWAAASALVEIVPDAARALYYVGGSFGGGIGALMLPWDPRFRRAFLAVPSFGNHPLRVTLPCEGSGESVRRYHASHPEALGVLSYFDAATAARHIRIPVVFSCARFDPVVPPPGQFAVHNAVPGQKRLLVRRAAHVAYAGEANDIAMEREAQRELFTT